MAEVTAAQVKELRQLTGAGITDCKKALVESDADITKAKDWLRARGAALAERKSDRETAEGLLFVASNDQGGVLVEILAETDFVTSNEIFRSFGQQVADAAVSQDCEQLADVSVDDKPIEQLRTDITLQIGENIQLGRMKRLSTKGSLANYVHHDGKIAVLADIEGLEADQARQLCMHIASMRPEALSKDDFAEDEFEAQRQSLMEAAAESDKPAEVQEKIVAGKLAKLMAERTLLMQEYVWEDKLTVGKFLDKNNASIHSYQLLAIGD